MWSDVGDYDLFISDEPGGSIMNQAMDAAHPWPFSLLCPETMPEPTPMPPLHRQDEEEKEEEDERPHRTLREEIELYRHANHATSEEQKLSLNDENQLRRRLRELYSFGAKVKDGMVPTLEADPRARTVIFRAQALATGVHYLIKLIRIDRPENPHDKQRRLYEAERRVLEKLPPHPNILVSDQFFLLRQENPRACAFVYEYVVGGDLCDFANKRRELIDERLVCGVVRQLAHALRFCYSNGSSHQDVKLENVMLRSVEPLHVQLVDWGFSQPYDPLLPSGGGEGTLDYAAPEVFLWKTVGRYDAQRADVWSLGVLAFGLLVGRLPFRLDDAAARGDVGEMLRRLRRSPFESPRTAKVQHYACVPLLRSMMTYEAHERPSWTQIARHDCMEPFFGKHSKRRRRCRTLDDALLVRAPSPSPMPIVSS